MKINEERAGGRGGGEEEKEKRDKDEDKDKERNRRWKLNRRKVNNKLERKINRNIDI